MSGSGAPSHASRMPVLLLGTASGLQWCCQYLLEPSSGTLPQEVLCQPGHFSTPVGKASSSLTAVTVP